MRHGRRATPRQRSPPPRGGLPPEALPLRYATSKRRREEASKRHGETSAAERRGAANPGIAGPRFTTPGTEAHAPRARGGGRGRGVSHRWELGWMVRRGSRACCRRCRRGGRRALSARQKHHGRSSRAQRGRRCSKAAGTRGTGLRTHSRTHSGGTRPLTATRPNPPPARLRPRRPRRRGRPHRPAPLPPSMAQAHSSSTAGFDDALGETAAGTAPLEQYAFMFLCRSSAIARCQEEGGRRERARPSRRARSTALEPLVQ